MLVYDASTNSKAPMDSTQQYVSEIICVLCVAQCMCASDADADINNDNAQCEQNEKANFNVSMHIEEQHETEYIIIPIQLVLYVQVNNRMKKPIFSKSNLYEVI